MTRKVTVPNWWRWTLRGLAVVALVIAVVPLTARPIARSDVPRHVDPVNGVIPAQRLTFNCLSPFDRVERKTTVSLTDLIAGKLRRGIGLYSGSPCITPTTDQEHLVEARGIGAVILIALSFLRRRRPVVTISVDPSVL